MAQSAGRLEHLFIIRVWQEPEQIKTAEWRGSVEHVPSGQRLYFVSFNDLNDFIRLRLSSPSRNAQD
jgi:hypothetical protein